MRSWDGGLGSLTDGLIEVVEDMIACGRAFICLTETSRKALGDEDL